VGERGDAAPGAAADVILDDSDDQGRRKAFPKRSFFMKIPLRLLLMATVLTSCCSTFVEAQTATVIPANLAAGHVSELDKRPPILRKVFPLLEVKTFATTPSTVAYSTRRSPVGFRRHRP
jgi:hypothetical protein